VVASHVHRPDEESPEEDGALIGRAVPDGGHRLAVNYATYEAIALPFASRTYQTLL
jgi:hypothetical protein